MFLMLKRPQYIALGAMVVLALVILNLPSKTTARLKLGIGSLFIPLFGLANNTQQLAGRAGDALLPRSELLRQNEALRLQNQELRLQVAQTEGIARENEHLRQMLAWHQQQRRGMFKPAAVVLRDPANWWRSVQIDLGTRDGLSNNLPVLAPNGALVGRVAAAGVTRSQVVLLGDPNCKVAARVDNASRDSGVIRGAGPLDSQFVDMAFLSRNANLKPGQDVRTTGQGGIYPKDILIGRVVDTRSVDYGLENVARVKLAANLSALDEVWVMLEP